MKSITVKQPWAWAIGHGKNVENRVWQRSYRGPLAVHAGKGWDLGGEFSPLVKQAWWDAGNEGDLVVDFPGNAKGAIVAVADLVGICSEMASPYALSKCGCGPWAMAGQYHWRLANVRPMAEPVPCKGSLGLWTLPDEVEAAVVAQLGEQVSARG